MKVSLLLIIMMVIVVSGLKFQQVLKEIQEHKVLLVLRVLLELKEPQVLKVLQDQLVLRVLQELQVLKVQQELRVLKVLLTLVHKVRQDPQVLKDHKVMMETLVEQLLNINSQQIHQIQIQVQVN